MFGTEQASFTCHGRAARIRLWAMQVCLGQIQLLFLCVHKWIICHETRNDLHVTPSQFVDVCPRSGGDFGGNLHIVARYIACVQYRCWRSYRSRGGTWLSTISRNEGFMVTSMHQKGSYHLNMLLLSMHCVLRHNFSQAKVLQIYLYHSGKWWCTTIQVRCGIWSRVSYVPVLPQRYLACDHSPGLLAGNVT